MVAKSYQRFEIAAGPFTVKGRQYVTLSNGRQVRYYTEEEYYKMYPEEKQKETDKRPLKEVLGFEKDYITICKGNTYQYLAWFKESDFRFSRLFGWYLCSSYEIPDDLPDEIIPIRLEWKNISNPSGLELLSEAAIKAHIETLMYEPSPSNHIGTIGERSTHTLTVIKTVPLDGYYGRSTLHIFEDKNQNIYTWTTGTKALEVGETYQIKGTLKDHTIFHNTKQNVLTRCVIL